MELLCSNTLCQLKFLRDHHLQGGQLKALQNTTIYAIRRCPIILSFLRPEKTEEFVVIFPLFDLGVFFAFKSCEFRPLSNTKISKEVLGGQAQTGHMFFSINVRRKHN